MKIEEILTNKFLRFVIPGIIFFFGWNIYRNNFSRLDSTVKRINCEKTDRFRGLGINGIISTLYKDERKLRRVKITTKTGIIDNDIFFVEGSDFYDYLKEGDSVNKEIGSLELKVRRAGKDTVHVLYYGCK